MKYIKYKKIKHNLWRTERRSPNNTKSYFQYKYLGISKQTGESTLIAKKHMKLVLERMLRLVPTQPSFFPALL